MKTNLYFIKKYLLVLIFTLASVLGLGQTTIFTESMGVVSGTTTIAAHETANGFDNDSYTMTSGGATNPGDLRNTTVSSGYSGASGGANIWLTTTSGQYGFAIEGIDASLYTSLTLSYGYYKNSSTAHATFQVDYWNGTSWVNVANTSANLFNESATAAIGWYLAKPLSLPAAAQINGLKIRFIKTSGTNAIRLDDVKLTGTLSGFYSITSGDWSTGSTWNTGTVPTASDNVTITSGHTVTTSSAITRDNTTTINGILALTNQLTGTTAATVNGTLQLNSGGYTTTSPKYTSGSTLKYNTGGNYGRYNEWNQASGTLGTTAGYPDNVQISNNTTLNYNNLGAAKLDGSLTIDAGSMLDQNYSGGSAGLVVGKNVLINGTLKLGGSTGGDITVGGNWTDNGTFTPNNRAVYFNGTAATQTITQNTGTETFNYVLVTNSSTIKLATGTNVVVNGTDGLSLSTTATNSIDLNGQTFTLSGGGNLNVNTGTRKVISSVTGGVFKITSAAITVYQPGIFTFGETANPTFSSLVLENGFNAGTGATTTLNSILQINGGGYVTGNTLSYATGSLLKYNVNGTYNRNYEWNGTASPVGVPYNVQLSNNCTLNYVNSLNLANQYITNNLTIDSGSSFFMDYGSATCGGSLNIGNNLTSAGNMTLGFASGDDLKIGGNINFTSGYTFDAKTRAIYFTKAGTQTITASSTPTFHYVVFSAPTTVVQLATGTSLNITAPNTGNVIAFNAATNVFDINGNTLTLGTTGIANVISGLGTFKGSTTSNLTLLGTGSIGTLNFTTGSQNLGTFTINRQASTIAAVLGTPVTVNTTLALTNGLLDLNSSVLTLGSTSGAGSITGGSSSSYLIADRPAGGSFKRFTPTATSYVFPIGDSSVSANGTEYSPATINLTTATLTSASYLQMNVEDAIEPNNDATTDFITRYWNLNGNGVTTATYDFSGTYLPVDIVGTESISKSGRYATSSGWTEGTNLSANTVSLTGLTTATGVISTTSDTNHFSGGNPFKKAEINIKQGSTTYLTGDTYAFGNVEINTNKDITFTIENLGIENLNLSAATITGTGFSLFTNYTTPVAGSSNTTFVIRFTPNALSAFSGSISIPNNDATGAENPYIINFTGTGVTSSLTDIIAAGAEQNTISSTINNTAITDNTKGVQVWQFTIRDGGATGDNDNLPSILTSLNIAKSAFSAVNDWRDAIYSIGLFDGSTLLATGNVTSATQIQFTGLNVSVADNSSKTLSVRLSLKCPLGTGALDGDDFVFSISNANATFSNTGSGSAAFSAAVSTDAKNVIDVTATKLAFTTQPMTTAVNQTMPTVRVAAVDDCGNVDKSVSGTISITSTGTLLTSPITASLTSGVATFNTIVHTVVDTNRTLSATNGTLTAISNPFDIIATNNFEKGDFVVVGVNSNISSNTCTNPTYPGSGGSYSSGADEISFFSFKNIYNGDTFFITDNGYERTNAAQWADSEGVYKIVRTGGTLAAGTVVTFWLRNETPFMEFISPDNGWTMTKDAGFPTNNVVLNAGGDQIYFMQGGSWTNGAATHDAVYNPGAILFAFNTNSSWTSFANSTQQSGLYPGMRCFSVLPNAATDYIEYTGAVTPASRRDWIERINNPNNWTDRSSCGGYTRAHVDQTYTILSGTTVNGLWRGSTDDNWFDCSNWDNLNVPDQSTNVSIPTAATNNVLISSTAVDASLYGSIAKANDIDISKTLTIEGSTNNKLEVYGNLTINAGGTLDMDDGNTATQDGQIYLYNGNWTNNVGEANFLQGQSTVHFLGSTPQIINANNHASYEKFGNVVMGNNFNTSVSNNLFMDGYFTLNTNKTLNIAANDFVDIAGAFSNYGTISVQNDGNLVQREGSTYTSNNQNVSVYRNALMKRLDYNYWGAPVAAQQLKAFSPATVSSRFYEYHETDDLFYSVSWLTNFVPGKGFAIRAPNNYTAAYQTFNGAFAGVPNNGNVTQSLSYTTTLSATHAEAGYNLIANPYASNIDFDELFNDNTTLINKIAYFWTNTNVNPPQQGSYYTQENYAVYNGSGGVPSTHASTGAFGTSAIPTNIIKVGQGFMVSAKQAGTLTIKNRIRTSSINGSFFNVKTAPKDRYWLELITPVNNVNTILLAYVNGATNNYDGDYDAKLLTSASDEFYSYLPKENTSAIDKLVIQGKEAPLNIDDKVLLGANFFENGNYTIQLAHKEGVFGGEQPIFLLDKSLNIYTDLQKDTYTFAATLGENNSRFEIIYNPLNALSTDDIKDKGFVIYKENKGYRIISDQTMKSIELYDTSGKLINKTVSNSKNYFIENKNAYKGVYVVKINTADKIFTSKIIF